MSNEELWQAVLAQLQFQISPANFATWLKNTFILSKKDGELTVSVPNNFSKEWLQNKYNKIIFHILKSLDNDIKDIKYIVDRTPQKPKEVPIREVRTPETQLELQELKIDKSTSLNPRYV